MAKKKGAGPRNLPSKAEILEFVQTAGSRVGKREITRAFGIKGSDRITLKALLKEMGEAGEIEGSMRRLSRPGTLPPVTVLDITERDSQGDFVARPSTWSEEHGPPPRILMVDSRRRSGPATGIGDRVLARLTPQSGNDDYAYQARTIKRLPKERQAQLGIFRLIKGRGGVIDPIDRRQLKEWTIAPHDRGDAEDGELVRFEPASSRRYGVPAARITARLGNLEDQRAISLIAIHAHGIPDAFSDAALAEAEAADESVSLAKREDLRAIPLVTIDPPDARDHDDAVWAEADSDPDNRGGWVVIVAIADVAHYVRPSSAMDREALTRGNSVYFPDRVVPMLPQRISNELCSLVPGEARPCLAVRMVFDKHGQKREHRFLRGLMRSASSLSYEQAQAAIDGRPDDVTGPLLDTVLRPLWGAYAALSEARDKRAPLDLDLPERKILLDERGQVSAIVTPPRLDAHRLIEEFMIQANVAAAETLEAKSLPLIYRVHDTPSKEKLVALHEFLDTLDIKLPKTGQLKPAHFNRVLAETRESPVAELVSEVILRSQAQAEYRPDNFGHFGLNLRRYAHFTSPIRRYADLVVHRALIRAHMFGEGGLSDADIPALERTAEIISLAERRAMAAERETVDRLIAHHLADRIGAVFAGRVSGVTKTGLFVRLAETGADGFVSASAIGHEYFFFDEGHRALIGEDTGLAYQLGDQVEVRLVEAIPTAGALRFELLSEGRQLNRSKTRSGKQKTPLRRPGRRGRPRRR